MTTVREEAHRLLDEVPEAQLAAAVDLLRTLGPDEPAEPIQRRRFRTTANFDGEPDLSARAKQITREGWDARRTA
jgi:hypothetical protein